MKKIIGLIALIMITMLFLVACGEKDENKVNNDNQVNTGNQQNEVEEYVTVNFADMYEISGTEKNISMTFQNLNGKKVKINGYPALLTPVDESFIYLNEHPYVTSPFAVIGEDKKKLEVFSVFMADNTAIPYTENEITVYGRLEVGELKNSDGYTTQVRIYADKVESLENSEDKKDTQKYYNSLAETGALYNLQNLQMNMEYISNPEFMADYGNTKKEIVEGIISEYIAMDNEYTQNFGEEYSYLIYFLESSHLVQNIKVEDESLKGMHQELNQIYRDQIALLQKYEVIAYRNDGKEMTDVEAEQVYNELISFNEENKELYDRFINWKIKLVEM